ncbi:MAG TPA: DUF262 domain-containing protein [Kiritimatiellia bacterium]|nr:DUF262 domain-containing protein [Saprospiraceae bacterium]HMP00786.1 DUF262 domain-containing protein [Kiritimatiellia bacterium]
MKTSATNRKLRLLLTGIQNQTLVPRPEFQRRLVWANKHKLAFLKTILDGYPFPEIYIASGEVDSETGEGKEMLVDGQQRISTLYQYFKGSPDLILSKDLKSYRELSEQDKISFLEYEVVIRDLGNLPVSDILEVFRRINSTNYALNAMEIHNARFDGEFKEFGDTLAAHPFFESNRFFSAQEIRRMGDTKFCLVLVATMLSGYFNRDDNLETYLEKYNAEFDQKDELERQFNAVAEMIQNCNFSPKSRVWKKADLFSIIVELHRALHKRKISLSVVDTSMRVSRFMDSVDSVSDPNDTSSISGIYYKAALQATNDRGNRIKRGEILQAIIDPSYSPELGIEHAPPVQPR